jgi:two-component system osmolarity sensor histidine kinase EnvZ
MFRRLGLFGRILSIFIVLMLFLVTLSTALIYLQRAGETGRFRPPLPDQVGAIVELLEADPGRRQTVLRAANTVSLRVAIEPAPPPVPEGARRLQRVERAFRNNVPGGENRDIRALLYPEARNGRRDSAASARWIFSNQPLRIDVPLADGTWLVAETTGELSRRVFGLPPGFWLGIFGFLLAAVALVTLTRELRPIRRIAVAADRFAETGAPAVVPECGASEARMLARAFNTMQDRIASLLKGRAVLLGAVSHDLKTTLTRLRLRVEALKEEAQRDGAIADIENMTALIDDSIGLARGATVSDRLEPVDLVELLRSDIAPRDGAVVTLSPKIETARMNADPIALKRLFGNLVDNAVTHGSRCDIGLDREGAWHVVTIDDDGPGIAADEREAVFEPFYRLDGSRNRDSGGSGLGLAIARQVVAGHGGRISVDDSPLGGTRMQVKLPVS